MSSDSAGADHLADLDARHEAHAAAVREHAARLRERLADPAAPQDDGAGPDHERP